MHVQVVWREFSGGGGISEKRQEKSVYGDEYRSSVGQGSTELGSGFSFDKQNRNEIIYTFCKMDLGAFARVPSVSILEYKMLRSHEELRSYIEARIAALSSEQREHLSAKLDATKGDTLLILQYLPRLPDEKLLPELIDCIQINRDEVWIKHPYFNTKIDPETPAFVNECFLRRKAIIDECLAQGEWGQLFCHIEKPWRLEKFFENRKQIPEDRYWDILRDALTHTEFTYPYIDKILIMMEERSDFRCSLMNDDERSTFSGLPEVITVYRGYAKGRLNGLSWTLSEDTAMFFANRFKVVWPEVFISEGQVKKSQVLAYFSERGESEILVNPKDVKKRENRRV